MYGHRPGTGISVVLSKKRVVRRPEEGLSASGGHAPHKNQQEDPVGESGEHSRDAPEDYGHGHHPLAREAVTGPASERHAAGVEKVEYGRNEADGGVSQIQGLPDCRKHGIEDLTVSLIQEICHPQQQKHLPLDPGPLLCRSCIGFSLFHIHTRFSICRKDTTYFENTTLHHTKFSSSYHNIVQIEAARRCCGFIFRNGCGTYCTLYS